MDRLEANLDRISAETRERQAKTEANLDRISAETRERQAKTEANLDRISAETRERQAKTEANLDRIATETKNNLDRLSEEMREFKAEMAVFKTEMRASSQAADKRWGDLSNKMGTLVEDIIAQGIPEIFQRIFHIDIEPAFAIRQRRPCRGDHGRMREFDAYAFAGGYFLLNETKGSLGPQDIPAFLDVLKAARDYFPEIEDRKVMGALGTFHVDPSLAKAGERAGLIMIGLNTGLLRILNSPDFSPAEF
ncbi:MAG: hypothetical protein MUF51_01630 [Vicinamibacteria bacterium]|nr:hypothetical protein [Vicinamibacteria bacterium]